MSETRRTYRRLDMGRCALCGRLAYGVYDGGALVLKDKKPLCGNCVRRFRFLFPVSLEYAGTGEARRKDGLAELRAEDILRLSEQVNEKLEDLRAQYAPWNAVFRIDTFRTEKQGLLKPARTAATGYVVLGKFNPGDRVTLLQGERRTELRIDEIAMNLAGGQAGEAGYVAAMYLSQKGLTLRAGDLLCKAGDTRASGT